MQKKVAHKQSLFDFAIQHCGTVAAALPIAFANNISPSAELATGTVLSIPDDAPTDPQIAAHYANNNLIPATLITISGEFETGGIDFMSIEGTFIVM